MAEWIERWTGDRVVHGSNPAAATYSLRNFGNSVYPALPVYLVLSGVYQASTLTAGRVIFFLSMLRAWAVFNCLIWGVLGYGLDLELRFWVVIAIIVSLTITLITTLTII